MSSIDTPDWSSLKRLTLIIDDGQIEHVFYPVFPPDQNAGDVVAWLRDHPGCPTR